MDYAQFTSYVEYSAIRKSRISVYYLVQVSICEQRSLKDDKELNQIIQ